MDWKELVKPIIKFCLKFGLNFGLARSAKKVKENPEKGGQISGDVAKLGTLIQDDAKAIGDGDYNDAEQKASDKQVDAIVDAIFAY